MGTESTALGPGQSTVGATDRSRAGGLWPAWLRKPFGQSGIGAGIGAWGQQRQLSYHDVGEVVRQLLPLLPQVVGQAQYQPQAAYGYGPYGQQWPLAQAQRTLTQQDVNEVVRQILPIVPQIVSLLQGQAGPQAAAIHGGYGGGGYGWSQQPWGQIGAGQSGFGFNPLGQNPWGHQQQPFGQFGSQFGSLPAYQAAYGGTQGWGQQRQLNQADVGEVARQLSAIIPQVIANLQAQQQQRVV